MPRPSLAHIRTEEMLDAFMRCVARFGLDGSTLERISEEAEVGRPMLRHYLGNRDQMVEKLIAHVMAKFEAMNEALFSSLPDDDRVSVLLDILFSDAAHEEDNAAVFQALVAASDRHKSVAEQLLKFVNDFEAGIARELMRAYPRADLQSCSVVATGITAIYFNHDATLPLGPTSHWREKSRSAVELLLKSLG